MISDLLAIGKSSEVFSHLEFCPGDAFIGWLSVTAFGLLITIITLQIGLSSILMIVENMSVLLSSFRINLLAFNQECRPLIGYATYYLFCDR